jgi:hypothetical protein
MRRSVFYFYHLGVYLLGQVAYAEPFFLQSSDGQSSPIAFTKLGESLVQCLNLEKGTSPIDLIKYVQERSPSLDQDIWDESNCDPSILCSPEDLYDFLWKFGWIDNVTLRSALPIDCIFILGGTIPGMRDRIHWVLDCFRNQRIQGTPKIVFFASERKLNLYDGKGFIQELEEKKYRPTESSAARYLWQGIVPAYLFPLCEFITSEESSRWNIMQNVMTAFVHWLRPQPNSHSWRILLVGSQPWLHLQYLVLMCIFLQTLPEFYQEGGSVETIGIAAPTMYFKSGARRSEAFKVNVLWKSIALTILEEWKMFELQKQILRPVSSDTATEPSTPDTSLSELSSAPEAEARDIKSAVVSPQTSSTEPFPAPTVPAEICS